MDKIKRIIRMPQYMKNFKCIGPNCQDNCCIGWDVDIDKKTFKKYKKVRDGELTRLFNKHVHHNPFAYSNEIDFGKVKLLKNKKCPFLNDNRLCRIQLKLGEEYLSNVCSTYPRIINKLNDVFEYSATVSCPEAARLILLNPKGICFVQEEGIETRNIINDSFNTHESSYGETPIKYLEELRSFTIWVLQDRRHLLWERLLVLGYFFEKLQHHINKNLIDEIPELLDSYRAMIKTGSFKNVFSDTPIQYSTQISVLKELVDKLNVFSEIDSKKYVEFTKEFLKGLGYNQKDKTETNGQRYALACEKYYAPFMKDHSYILENYLVNHVFENLFPFSETDKPYDAYMILVIRYALIKLNLVGIAAYHKGLTEKLVVEFIQSFSKTVEHHKTYLGDIVAHMKQKKYNTIEYMELLLKN